MGHIRLGSIPKTRKWKALLSVLDEPNAQPGRIAGALAEITKDELQGAKKNDTLQLAFLRLVEITQKSSSVPEVGFSTSVADLASRLVESVRAQVSTRQDAVSDLAVQALHKTLVSELQENRSLFAESNGTQLQRTLSEWKGEQSFGWLTRVFFANFYGGYLRYVVNKEVSNHVGTGRALVGIADAKSLDASLDTYALQVCRIVQDYGAEWVSKKRWEKSLDRQTANTFVSYALRKLQSDLEREQ